MENEGICEIENSAMLDRVSLGHLFKKEIVGKYVVDDFLMKNMISLSVISY